MKIKRIEYDPRGGAAYIYFEDIKPGEATNQIAIPGGIVFDLDRDGRVLGIELLDGKIIDWLTDKEVVKNLERAHIPLVENPPLS